MDKGPGYILLILAFCFFIVLIPMLDQDYKYKSEDEKISTGIMGQASFESLFGGNNDEADEESSVQHFEDNPISRTFSFESVFEDFTFIFDVKNFRAMEDDKLE